MDTALLTPAIGGYRTPGPRLLTVADLDALPSSLPSGDIRYELDDGRLVILPHQGASHGRCQAHIGSFLSRVAEDQSLGIALASVAIILPRHPARAVLPDAPLTLHRSP